MLIEKTEYEITVLCRDDDETVRKVNDGFNEIKSRIFNENPELGNSVSIVAAGVRFTERKVRGRVVRLRRLTWDLKGTDGSAEKFIKRYREMDKNPYQYFIVRPTFTLGQLAYLMNIREEDKPK